MKKHKKYFVGFCTMDREHLRSNPLFHSSLVFFEASYNEQGIKLPLRVVDSYGLYSHAIPGKTSLFDDPITFFSQKLGFYFRIRNSFSEWKQECIHDLCLGKGLSGRLFEMSEEQIEKIKLTIKEKIKAQDEYFFGLKDVGEKEDRYNSIIINEKIYLMEEEGLSREEAEKKAHSNIPIKMFNYPILGGEGYTCKVAGLDLIKSVSDPNNKKLHDRIELIRGNNTVPRFSYDLDQIVIDAYSANWEEKGTTNKFPFCEWEARHTDPQFSMIAVDIGGKYIDRQGNLVVLPKLTDKIKNIIADLKVIERLCQIYTQEDEFYRKWQADIHRLIKNFALQDRKQQEKNYNLAVAYLEKLFDDEIFEEKMNEKIPQNLTAAFNKVQNQYICKIYFSR